jgi:class 3 adenylate cyclase/alkanesulfonate monooxygenase SsuD/methylene tetrahydromethanopterin reductase-like flavin-dependent oxidoreductase (luciferase family)
MASGLMHRGLGVTASLDAGLARELAAQCEWLGYHSLWSNDEPAAAGLDTLAEFAKATRNVGLGVGVLPLHRHRPAEIAAAVDRLAIDPARLWLGIGSGALSSQIDALRRAVAELRELLPDTTRIVVAAMRPRLCRLGGALADGVLLNWMLPSQAARARGWVREGAAERGRAAPVVASYVRVAVGSGGSRRVAEEESFYRNINESHREHFAAMGVQVGSVGIAAAQRADLVEALAPYHSALDLPIVRARGRGRDPAQRRNGRGSALARRALGRHCRRRLGIMRGMPPLTAKERAQLPDSAFAYIDSSGKRRLPIHDAAHVRNALARFGQVAFEDEAARDRARSRLLRAAKKHGIMPIGFISAQLQPQRKLPKGQVTFLLTDIEGSTELLGRLEDRYAPLLADVRRLVRTAVRSAGGREVSARGDDVFAVFERAPAALEAALAIQREMHAHAWPGGNDVRLRIGLHRGRPALTDTGYVGLSVHAAARICFAAHGGQIVMSSAVRSAVIDSLADGVSLSSLGAWRFHGLREPVDLFQVDAAGLLTDFPPPRSAAPAR